MSSASQMIAGVTVVCVALVMVVVAFFVRVRAKAQFHWRQVFATVVAAAVEITNVISANIEYEYEIDGKRFRGSRLRTLRVEWGFWGASAHRTIDKYPVGSTIVVFVDPSDPSKSLIEPGGDKKFLPFVLVMSALAAGVGLRLIYAATN